MTDGQNYDSQDRASIAASRGKKLSSSYDFSKQSYYIRVRISTWKMGRILLEYANALYCMELLDVGLLKPYLHVFLT